MGCAAILLAAVTLVSGAPAPLWAAPSHTPIPLWPDGAPDAVGEDAEVIAGYPVVTMVESWTHTGSRDHLLGDDQTPERLAELSNEKQVTKRRRRRSCFTPTPTWACRRKTA